MKKWVELLAPCGDYESFLAAVNAGADAVYLGGEQFGARAYAENFSQEELVKVIRQAHIFGVKVYLTVNTLVKEREFAALYDYLLPFYETGLDGIIVQDIGVLRFLKRNFPDCKLHASTQMTITGTYGASYMKELGCTRIVPARELSLQEIKILKQEVPVEIEAFIHGAMCYCYSGQCLMSSMIGARSGNRGRCAAPCRLPYQISGKEGHFLSLKDMNTLEHIPELIEAGIDAFKIEGRMKRPEYVAGTVSIYRKYIDKYYKGEFGTPAEKDKRMLSTLYMRTETGSGYYFRNRGREMLTLQKPGYNEALPELLKELRETYIRELPGKAVRFFVRCRAKEALYGEVYFWDAAENREICLSVSGGIAQKADKRAISEEEIRSQLGKMGGTPYSVKDCEIELGENTFVPVQWIKALRRTLLEKIDERYGARYPEKRMAEGAARENRNREDCTESGKRKTYRLISVVQTKEQFETVFSAMAEIEKDKPEKAPCAMEEYLIADGNLLLEDEEIRDRLLAGKVRWGIKCPLILRNKDAASWKKLAAVIEKGAPGILYCGTIDALAWAKGLSYQGQFAGEASLYAWNREAVFSWGETLNYISIPLELDSGEIRELCGSPLLNRLEAPVYGRAPFMVSANCVKLSAGQCDGNRKRYAELKDRKGNVFPVYTNCGHCYNIIYNYLPTSYHENLWMLLQDDIGSFRMEFTTESGAQTGEVRQTFRTLLASELEKRSITKQEKRKNAGSRKPERKKGNIAGMETTQGCLRRPVE